MSLPTGDIARVCHEANRAMQMIQANPAIPVSPVWDELDMETRLSALHGVTEALHGTTPEESHQNWMDFKLERGWKLGPVKDEVKKEHPLLVPYSTLPVEQQLKDKLFLAVVQALS